MISSLVFDDAGKPYDVSRILTPNYQFDHEAYNKYSKVYLPITYVLSYGVQFASLSALVTHTVCWHGRDIWQQSLKSFASGRGMDKSEYQPVSQEPTKDAGQISRRSSKTDSWSVEADMTASMGGEDVHNRLMRKYDDAPITWYLAVFLAMLAIGIFVVEYYPVYLPWYGLLLALAITAVLFIPVGIVMAITNQHSSLYLICQLICGVVFPGKPVANMVSLSQSLYRVSMGMDVLTQALGIRHILLHQLRPRHKVRLRPQTRSLHENPTSTSVQGPSRRHAHLKRHPDRSPELDVQIHPQYLHDRRHQRLYLSDREGAFQWQYLMGCCRSTAVFRGGRIVSTVDLGVCRGVRSTCLRMGCWPEKGEWERMEED